MWFSKSHVNQCTISNAIWFLGRVQCGPVGMGWFVIVINPVDLVYTIWSPLVSLDSDIWANGCRYECQLGRILAKAISQAMATCVRHWVVCADRFVFGVICSQPEHMHALVGRFGCHMVGKSTHAAFKAEFIHALCCCFCGWCGVLLFCAWCGDNHSCCQGADCPLHVLLVACSDVNVLAFPYDGDVAV